MGEPLQSAERNPVEVLAEEFADRIRAGENPSIEEYVSRVPEEAETIRAVFGSILAMERLGQREQTQRTFETQAGRLARPDQTLGDFRIEREIGRGGMGIVYEAIQQSLNRRVALKILGPNIAGSSHQLRRFKAEAEAAARLHHTNIVPVYGIGTHEGLHFYAMQFIDGASLSRVMQSVARLTRGAKRETEVLPDTTVESAEGAGDDSAGELTGAGIGVPAKSLRHSEPAWEIVDDNVLTLAARRSPDAYARAVARIGAELADALDYAHQSGVIHRDIKPANLLLDRSGTVWITDFGLAKHTAEESYTASGDIIGTLRYMAPEQFSGESDHRCDIYALGLTLYELLTLQPAFDDTRHGPLIKAKTTGSLRPLGQVRRGIARDLETIVHKACATDPHHRYAAASQLADDLHCFLEDRTISARRPSLPERLYRVSRRNPLVASLSGGLVACLIALLIVSATGNYRTQMALDEAEAARRKADESLREKTAALAEAESERTRAQANLGLAVEAFEQIMENVSSRIGADSLSVELADGSVAYGTGVVTDADAAVLTTLLQFFARFAQANATDFTLETAAAQRRAGDILYRLGRLDEAEAVYKESLSNYAKLEAVQEAEAMNRDAVVAQLQILNSLSLVASARGSIKDAFEYYQQTRVLFDFAEGVHPLPAAQFQLARALNLHNATHWRVGIGGIAFSGPPPGPPRTPPRGFDHGDRRPPFDRRPRGRGPGRPEPRGPFGPPDPSNSPSLRALQRLQIGSRRLADREEVNREAIDLLERLVERDPDNPDYSLELAMAFRDKARIARIENDLPTSRSAYDQSLGILRTLIEKHPNSPHFRYVYADTLSSSPKTRHFGIFQSNHALMVSNELVAQYPHVPDYKALQASIQIRHRSARADEEAVATLEQLVAEYPTISQYRFLLAEALLHAASAEASSGESEEAVQRLDRAIEVLRNYEADDVQARLIQYYSNRLEQRREDLQKRAGEEKGKEATE